MGRIHPYGESKTEDSSNTEFFGWLIMIGLGFPIAYGWIFVSWGWIGSPMLFALSGALGGVIGLKMPIGTAWHKKKKLKNADSTLPVVQEVEKVASLNLSPQRNRSLDELANARCLERRGYGS